MSASRSLLFKGLGVCSICCAGGIAAYTQWDSISSLFSLSYREKIDEVGLECGEEDGSECSIKNQGSGGKVLVKGENNDTPFELTSLGDGKIKLYGDRSHNYGFRFSIEGNDIVDGTNKLEQFESYEIKEDIENGEEDQKNKYYLSRKTDAKTGIRRALGLPCDLPNDGASQVCSINSDNIGKINFNGGKATVSGTVTLTITKDSSGDDHPLGYGFSFKNTGSKDVTLTIGNESIKLKKSSPVDFRIKKVDGTNNISLERTWTIDTLAPKAGLKKEGDYWIIGETGLNIKQDTNKEAGRKKTSNQSGKIKVYEEQEGYNEGFRFSIEIGDIALEQKQDSTIKVLGQYENYEIKKEEGTWYLARKTKNSGVVKNSLGLPCELPIGNASVVCPIDAENIGKIKFEGGTATLEGSPKLTISGNNSRDIYPFGYKFLFSSDSDSGITVGSVKTSLGSELSVEFKIKSKQSGLFLEEAWTAESLMKQVNFKKEGGDDAWTPGSSNVSIKQGVNKSNKVTATGTKDAKIRVYEGVPGYNQGFKFVIEDGDTDLSSTTNINKLTKYETYEVSMDGTDKQWYFNRKLELPESMREILGLPKKCSMPSTSNSPTSCSLNVSEMNGIKFDGKSEGGSVSITDGGNSINLSISKVSNGSDFPLGYKFTFSSNQYGFTIPKNGGSGDITISKGTNKEFKIKESGGESTLEVALT